MNKTKQRQLGREIVFHVAYFEKSLSYSQFEEAFGKRQAYRLWELFKRYGMTRMIQEAATKEQRLEMLDGLGVLLGRYYAWEIENNPDSTIVRAKQ